MTASNQPMFASPVRLHPIIADCRRPTLCKQDDARGLDDDLDISPQQVDYHTGDRRGDDSDHGPGDDIGGVVNARVHP